MNTKLKLMSITAGMAVALGAALAQAATVTVPLGPIHTGDDINNYFNGGTDSTGPGADRLHRIIANAWALAYQRPVGHEELDAAVAFVAEARGGDDPELAALTDLCQQLLCSNEFLYVD